jgi:nucleoid-associated protein YgaU
MRVPELKSIIVAGGNLFQIAAQELNDATQWIRIAQLNSITDPNLSGVTTLAIPDQNPTSSGGIVAQ